MTFPINTSIPAAGNNPSVDQPGIQANFANISGFLAVDHRAPGSSNAGQHNQVTFKLNQTAPSIAGGVGGLFTNSLLGMLGTVSSLLFQNGTQSRLTNINLTSNNTVANGTGTNWGFTSPWGLIFNFGAITINSNPCTMTFAIPMTNAQYVAIGQVGGTSTAANSCTVTNFGANTFQLNTTKTGNIHFYIALGS
jgi:hypothetical protein